MTSSASRALLERIRMNCYPDASCVKPKLQSSDTGGIATTHWSTLTLQIMRFETDRRWNIFLQFSIRTTTVTLLCLLATQRLVHEKGGNSFPLHSICQALIHFFLYCCCLRQTGPALIQQGPPQRLNCWRWHLIYWQGGWQWICFRSNCLYEGSPWTLQMLGIQTSGDI